MGELLLAFSVAALLCGNCAFGMDDDITMDELAQKFENLTLEDDNSMDVDDLSLHKAAPLDDLKFENSTLKGNNKVNESIKRLENSNNSSLHKAVWSNDLEKVKSLIEMNVNVNSEDAAGETPLFDAIRLKNLEIVKHLIKNGADINFRNKRLETPLKIAESLSKKSEQWLPIFNYLKSKIGKISSSQQSNHTTTRNLLNRTKDPNECEKLVRDGTFASILKKHSDSYNQTVRDTIADQLKKVGGIITETVYINGTATWSLPISRLVSRNQDLFKDPNFVISLKSGFEETSKLYENNKNSEMWIPFAIVKNLKINSQKIAILIANDGNTVETTVIENPTSQRNNVNVQTQERVPSTTSGGFTFGQQSRNAPSSFHFGQQSQNSSTASRGFTFGQQPQSDNTFKTKSKKSAKSAAQALPI